MLHQAAQSGEEHVLLKLDGIKAFDRLDWNFLLACPGKFGMNGTLTRFLKASFANATSHVLLNGRLTRSICLTRSVRQRCPLPPLLFILAFDTLGIMLRDVISRRAIVGVQFPDLAIYALHNFYADDIYLIIRAVLCYILELQHILHVFGMVFGLVCAWDKTIVWPIPAGPLPLQLWLLPWTWEDDNNASKQLGFPTAQTIVVAKVEELILTKLENKMVKTAGASSSHYCGEHSFNRLHLVLTLLRCGLGREDS